MGLSVPVVFYTSDDSRETRSWSRAGIPQEALEAVGSLSSTGSSELSAVWHGQMGAAFHGLQVLP